MIYSLKKDEKSNCWTRLYYTVEANSLEEAINLITNNEVCADDVHFLGSDGNVTQIIIEDNKGNDIYDSEEGTVVDNSDIVTELIKQLKDPNDFIWVQIIQRKKDGNVLPAYTSGARNIRNFSFFNIERFEQNYSYIKQICEQNNARAYFWVNPKNTRAIACETAKHYLDLIANDNTYQGLTVWEKECGLNRSHNYDKLWVIDIDTKDIDVLNKYKQIILSCRGVEEERIKYVVPTLHGYHLITKGFDRRQFSQELIIQHLGYIDIYTNSPSLLYYNKKG